MKIKDLPKDINMDQVFFLYKNEWYKWCSQWNKGVWGHKEGSKEGSVTPIFVEDLEECLEWECQTND